MRLTPSAKASPSRQSRVALVFETAKANGLPVKLHADQLSNLHGAALAARFDALSADHIEYADETGIAAMAQAGTVAVLLPGAFYMLREKQLPPVDVIRRYHVPIAIATDCNPGTSPMTSLLLTMNMAATLFRVTVDECIAGVTREAARALGKLSDIGTIETGKSCDLAIWNIERPAELVYRLGLNPPHRRVLAGPMTDSIIFTPARHCRSPIGASLRARAFAGRLAPQVFAQTSIRAQPLSRRSLLRVMPSTASIPASANSRQCADCRAAISPPCSAISCCRMRPVSANTCRHPSCG